MLIVGSFSHALQYRTGSAGVVFFKLWHTYNFTSDWINWNITTQNQNRPCTSVKHMLWTNWNLASSETGYWYVNQLSGLQSVGWLFALK